jgi:nitrogen fixation protein FixH
MKKTEQMYPKGHFTGRWMGIGIAIFSGVGVALSVALKNDTLFAIGPGIGVAFGLAIGQAIENKYEKAGQIRPLTAAEKRKQKIATYIALGFLVMGVLAFAAFYALQ